MFDPLALFLLVALEAEAVAPGDSTPPAPDAAFARYQLILDRKPFGMAAAAGVADTPAGSVAGLPPLANSMKLVALEMDEDSGAVRAGIVDGAAKKSYYLTIGQEENEVKLVDADFADERALVRKGEQEEWLSMGGGAGKTAPTMVDASSDPNREIARRQRFREMMLARQASREKPAEAASTNAPARPWTNREEMREYYRKLNMDLIRANGRKGPPLPMPLSPEDDAQLVKEGVLPPPEPAAGP